MTYTLNHQIRTAGKLAKYNLLSHVNKGTSNCLHTKSKTLALCLGLINLHLYLISDFGFGLVFFHKHTKEIVQPFGLVHTVYPKKYAHGFCFAVLCCGYTLTDFPISTRLTSLAL